MDEFGTLWVEASEQDGIITIRIRDDGKGFEISEKMEQNAKDEPKSRPDGIDKELQSASERLSGPFSRR